MDTRLQDDVLRLRKRVNDLKALGYMTEESAGTYEQTVLQTWQEADRIRQTLVSQAATLRTQAAAAEAQANAYGTMASILFNIVNRFVEAGQKRSQEEAERKAERDAQEAEAAREAAPKVEASSPAKRGRPKK